MFFSAGFYCIHLYMRLTLRLFAEDAHPEAALILIIPFEINTVWRIFTFFSLFGPLGARGFLDVVF